MTQPLQNRVDPFGAIHTVAARGMFTGNRGVIHDPDTRTLLSRRWTTKAWIACACNFRGRKREVMGRNARSGAAGWTELFFLDEPTALAAGHRPCFFCRRQRAADFLRRFGDIFGIAAPKVAEMDTRLHAERLASGGKPRSVPHAEIGALPDGAMIALNDAAYAVRAGMAHGWSFQGYGAARAIAELPDGDWRLLTPPATLAVLAAGYRPEWHPSAGRAAVSTGR